jgi:hypothetical protein
MHYAPSNNNAARHHRHVACPLVLLLCVGCGARPATIGVQGDVSYEGRALDRGTIDFMPIDNTPGPSAVAPIANGRYAIEPKWGLMPDGVYQVRIAAFRKTGRKERNRVDRAGPPVEIEEDFIPPIYNSQSILRVRVSELNDRDKVDFHIGNASSPRPH